MLFLEDLGFGKRQNNKIFSYYIKSSMIRIICPNNNVPERTYAIEVLLIDVLGCKRNNFDVQFRDDINNYELMVGQNKYVFEDHFFNHHVESLSYLKLENLPKELHYFHGLGFELPIIYGEDKYIQVENGAIIGLDIFASAFFMLTRWEEFLLGREERGDCDETQLFCVRQGIHQRAIVNEYADLLRKFLPLDFPLLARNYSLVLSHDVDGFMPPAKVKIGIDLLKQAILGPPKNKVIHLTWQEEVKYRRAFPTAYSQFELYTALTEKYNIPEWFYFKVCSKGETEATYLFDSVQTKDVVEKLRRKNNPNFLLGFHPSQNVFDNKEQWNIEVDRITQLLQENPIIGRNHHLLYNHDILRMWESMGSGSLNISNSVFHYRQGFRSGICVPYHLFDIYQRRLMNLFEHPCQIMDTVIRYNGKTKSIDERWHDIQTIVDQVRKHHGELVLTWHIYVRNKKLIQEYYLWCEKVVQYAVK